MQTVMIIPVFVSYAAVQFIVMAYLSSGTGIINNLLGGSIPFYRSPKYWPYILTIVKMWNGVGYGSVLYMSVLAGIDTSLYEAASIDGASKWQQIRHVTLPSLVPMITVMLLLSVGGIMHSDTGLFYQVTRNTGILYETTQVIDSYVLNAIMKNSNFGFTAATTFFQSIVGLLLMLLANGIVKKIAPEDSLF
jgi:multiple sugar transport system permease protein/putative aldouronate transport system permease protein